MPTYTTSDIKQLIRPLRLLLYLGRILVFIAGTQLFVLAEQTDLYFARAIKPPLTAAGLGASYRGTRLFGFLSAREKIWARARDAIPSVIFLYC